METKRYFEIMKSLEPRWTEIKPKFSAEEKEALAIHFGDYYVDGVDLYLIERLKKKNISISNYAEAALSHGIVGHCSQNWDLNSWDAEAHFKVLDEVSRRMGFDPKKFVHNNYLNPQKERKVFLEAFFDALGKTKTFLDAVRLNSRKIELLPGLENRYAHSQHPNPVSWFGRRIKSHRKKYMAKLISLAKEANYNDLKMTIDYLRLKQRGRNAKHDELPKHMILNIDIESINRISAICLSKTNFYQALEMYNSVNEGSPGRITLDAMSKLAQKPAQHAEVMQIAFRLKKMKLWKKHALLAAEQLKKS